MRYLAPAGTPIGVNDLWRWLRALPGRRAGLERFRTALIERFELKGCEFVSSGRAGMTLLLETLRELQRDPQRTEVIIPGYTCFSVPASIERAGLRVRVCDIRPDTLSYDLDRLEAFDFSRVLAVVSANLYGIPNELPAIEALARRNGIYMVDDAAQAMGATIAGRAVGTFGDVGLFSLDKGKNITSMQGGILVTRDAEIAFALHQRVAALPRPSIADTVIQVLKLLAYAFLLPPSRYGITRRLPFLGLGRTPYVTPSPLTQYSRTLGVMASILFDRLDSLSATRRSNANRIMDSLASMECVRPVTPPAGANSVFVRLPMLTADRRTRDALVIALDAAGIGATASYPSAVADIAELQARLDHRDLDCPGARQVSECILTVPAHPMVANTYFNRIATAIKHVCCGKA